VVPVPDADPRVVELWEHAVEALRRVVIDLAITEDELHTAAAFFNRMGAEGNFFTLLDATLSTASLEAHATVSHSNVLGPVYLPGAPYRPDGNIVERDPGEGAEPFELSGRVFDVRDGAPIANSELDVWQADHLGRYDRDGYHLRGIVPVDADGRYVVKTIVPADYVSHVDDTIEELYALRGRDTFRAAHVHFKVRIDGREVLTTQVFRSDTPRLDTDLVVGIVRPELVMEIVPPPAGSTEPWRMTFDIPVDPRVARDADDRSPAHAATVGVDA
jgi:hydroxyquinol 1,2-dioxygenase